MLSVQTSWDALAIGS